MLSLVNISLDGELAKQHSDPSPSPTTSTGGSSTITTTTPPLPYPLPADTSPTSGHAPRLKRPTFLPIKNHARPATDKQGGKGDERVHDNTPLSRSTSHKAPSSSSSSSSYASLNRLPISMYQLPAVVTPTVVTPGIGGCLVDGRTASALSSATTNTPSTATPTSAPDNTLVARRNKAVYVATSASTAAGGGQLTSPVPCCAVEGDRYTDTSILYHSPPLVLTHSCGMRVYNVNSRHDHIYTHSSCFCPGLAKRTNTHSVIHSISTLTLSSTSSQHSLCHPLHLNTLSSTPSQHSLSSTPSQHSLFLILQYSTSQSLVHPLHTIMTASVTNNF
ncbi:hypothetical protein Pcinc_032171 [Petrolisthes cinctipes]|uniref:Uncharacterized protein n=1 Tax=Petrolisthes cinctipes TaxID=88211 RepID=A0AAE1EV21_PETCI|nr:hypothetical protein Pcinc_032171 [Petrolisthes cinctipes]